MSTEREFEAAVDAACRASTAMGYYPTYFKQMLTDLGPIKTAERLVLSGDLQTGLRKLAKMGKLELSIEFIMTQPEFRGLFSPRHVEAAEWRLSEMRKLTKQP